MANEGLLLWQDIAFAVNGTKFPPSDPGDDSGGSGGGYSLRPFHPKYGGHTSIKDALIARMKTDKVPGVH